eukprot:4452667-Alexandrium_andersonii.AAC.1
MAIHFNIRTLVQARAQGAHKPGVCGAKRAHLGLSEHTPRAGMMKEPGHDKRLEGETAMLDGEGGVSKQPLAQGRGGGKGITRSD